MRRHLEVPEGKNLVAISVKGHSHVRLLDANGAETFRFGGANLARMRATGAGLNALARRATMAGMRAAASNRSDRHAG